MEYLLTVLLMFNLACLIHLEREVMRIKTIVSVLKKVIDPEGKEGCNEDEDIIKGN